MGIHSPATVMRNFENTTRSSVSSADAADVGPGDSDSGFDTAYSDGFTGGKKNLTDIGGGTYSPTLQASAQPKAKGGGDDEADPRINQTIAKLRDAGLTKDEAENIAGKLASAECLDDGTVQATIDAVKSGGDDKYGAAYGVAYGASKIVKDALGRISNLSSGLSQADQESHDERMAEMKADYGGIDG